MDAATLMERLAALGQEKVKKLEIRRGAEKQFGVMLGEVRKLAKEAGSDAPLAWELWASGNLDARLAALLVFPTKQLDRPALETLADGIDCAQASDWFVAYVLEKHPVRDEVRDAWSSSTDPWRLRAAWSLWASDVQKRLGPQALEERMSLLEACMASAPPEVQWTMNFCLGYLGIHHEAYRARARALGEGLGLYRDWPVAKGCTSPYVPAWIDATLRRSGT